MDETEHQQQIDPAILRLARFKGRQLAGKYGFARHDDEDIRQDLLLDYLQRSRSFDSHRCSRRTFGQRIINNRVATLIGVQMAACRDYRVRRVSLDQTADQHYGQNSPRLDQIQRDRRSAGSQLTLRLDVERTLLRLPAALVSICRLVMVSDSAMDVAAKAGISRATLYRRLRQVRAAFVEAELGRMDTISRTMEPPP